MKTNGSDCGPPSVRRNRNSPRRVFKETQTKVKKKPMQLSLSVKGAARLSAPVKKLEDNSLTIRSCTRQNSAFTAKPRSGDLVSSWYAAQNKDCVIISINQSPRWNYPQVFIKVLRSRMQRFACFSWSDSSRHVIILLQGRTEITTAADTARNGYDQNIGRLVYMKYKHGWATFDLSWFCSHKYYFYEMCWSSMWSSESVFPNDLNLTPVDLSYISSYWSLSRL